MSSQFYRRYIPPQKDQVKFEEHPRKKRKQDSDGNYKKTTQGKDTLSVSVKLPEDGNHNDHGPTDEDWIERPSAGKSNVGESVTGLKLKKKEKKSKTLSTKLDEDEVSINQREPSNANHNGNLKHSNVLSRYEAARDSAAEQQAAAINGDARQGEELLEYHGLEPLPQPALDHTKPQVSSQSALPRWLQTPLSVPPSHSVPFSKLPLSREVAAILRDRGQHDAFAVQSAVIPLLLPGSQRHLGDLCISAPTGSGKTLAYVLPLIESLKNKPVKRLRALVVVPTRELVAQARDTVETHSSGLGINVGTAVGSKSLSEEQSLLVERFFEYDPEAYETEKLMPRDEDEELLNWDFDEIFAPQDDLEGVEGYVLRYRSKVDLLICTPGRLVEHITSTKGFSLQHVEWLVVDEADRLLAEAFQHWVDVVIPRVEEVRPLSCWEESVHRKYRISRERQVQKVVLSATMTNDVSKLSVLKLKKPKMVAMAQDSSSETKRSEEMDLDVSSGLQLPENLLESAVSLPDVENKPVYLMRLLDEIQNRNSQSDRNNAQDPSVAVDDQEHMNAAPLVSESARSSVSPTRHTLLGSISGGRSQEGTIHTFGTLIFTNNNENAVRLAKLITLLRPKWTAEVASLTKSSATSSGRKILNQLMRQKISILVASDRASRGLDIGNLAQVINYDMPTSLSNYVHRVGRTARAGKQGQATTLVGHHEARWFWNEIARADEVQRATGKKVNRVDGMRTMDKQEKSVYEEALQVLEADVKSKKEAK